MLDELSLPDSSKKDSRPLQSSDSPAGPGKPESWSVSPSWSVGLSISLYLLWILASRREKSLYMDSELYWTFNDTMHRGAYFSFHEWKLLLCCFSAKFFSPDSSSDWFLRTRGAWILSFQQMQVWATHCWVDLRMCVLDLKDWLERWGQPHLTIPSIRLVIHLTKICQWRILH